MTNEYSSGKTLLSCLLDPEIIPILLIWIPNRLEYSIDGMPDDIRPKVDADRSEQAGFLEIISSEDGKKPVHQEYFNQQVRGEQTRIVYPKKDNELTEIFF